MSDRFFRSTRLSLAVALLLLLAATAPAYTVYAYEAGVKPVTVVEIRRMKAARTPIVRILKIALGSGMDVEGAVRAIIRAGASPGLVVYFSITEGYDLAAALRAAITEGVPAAVVFSAAINAGAVEKDIAVAVASLGADPSDVADSIARAATPALDPR